jgi:hypothetical protein
MKYETGKKTEKIVFGSISESSFSFAKSKLDLFNSGYCSVLGSTEKTWTKERHDFVLLLPIELICPCKLTFPQKFCACFYE